MKAQVDIVSGFLGSGKTSFIIGILESEKLSKEKIVVLQYEAGEEMINPKENVFLEKASKEQHADSGYIRKIIEKHMPDRIIIEHNGMLKLSDLIFTLEENTLNETCRINRIFNIVDYSTFSIFINNMPHILTEQISNSDMIVINKIDIMQEDAVKEISDTLKAINNRQTSL